MLICKKAQLISEVFKYMLVALFSAFILIGGYKAVTTIREKSCRAEIAKFELSLKNIGDELRYGTKEMQSYLVPCGAGRIYFFDLGKSLDPEMFKQFPIMRDSIRTKANNNVFLVKSNDVLRSFYAGNLEIDSGYLCLAPVSDKISIFAEGAGKSVKLTASQEQPRC